MTTTILIFKRSVAGTTTTMMTMMNIKTTTKIPKDPPFPLYFILIDIPNRSILLISARTSMCTIFFLDIPYWLVKGIPPPPPSSSSSSVLLMLILVHTLFFLDNSWDCVIYKLVKLNIIPLYYSISTYLLLEEGSQFIFFLWYYYCSKKFIRVASN